MIVFDSLGYEDEMLIKKRLSRKGSMTGKKYLGINTKLIKLNGQLGNKLSSILSSVNEEALGRGL